MAQKSNYTKVLTINTPVELGETTLSINSGSQVSTILECGPLAPRAILLPDNWTPCDIILNVGKFSDQLRILTDFQCTDIVISTTAGRQIPLVAAYTDGVIYLQILCNVSQNEGVVIDTILAPIYQG